MDYKPTLAIDVDGVLRDNLQIICDIYNREFDEQKKVEDIKDFRTEISFPKIEERYGCSANKWLFQDHSKEIFLDAPQFEHVTENIEKLKEYFSIIICTYQKTDLNKIHTIQWLTNNGIQYDSIFFAKDKTRLICDLFVDDNDWNFIGSNAQFGVLIDAPYNTNKDIEGIRHTSHCKRMARFKNFDSFAKSIIINNLWKIF